MKRYFPLIAGIIILALMALLLYYSGGLNKTETVKVEPIEIDQQQEPESQKNEAKESFIDINNSNLPLTDAKERITKKPFGILIDSKTSPVQPEKFSGYHTGTDFEIFDSELETEIEVKAICDGEIVERKFVNGYGGVTIQSCIFNDKEIFVLYGHIDISNAKSSIGTLKKGETISVLANDKSNYSGGERKHLHLGIIDSQTINYKGYVDSEDLLVNWINYEEFIR